MGGASGAPRLSTINFISKNHKNVYKTYTKYIKIYESALPQHPSLISLVFWQCRDNTRRQVSWIGWCNVGDMLGTARVRQAPHIHHNSFVFVHCFVCIFLLRKKHVQKRIYIFVFVCTNKNMYNKLFAQKKCTKQFDCRSIVAFKN